MCADEMSGEHLISKNLFPGSVSIRGFPWCAEQFKTVGINSLTANILCRKHNSDLSELDAAAGNVWRALREVFDLQEDLRIAEAVTKTRPKIERRRYRLDGTRLERWCFKTTINMVASGNVRGFPADWEPRRELAEYVFGRSALPDGCGVGLAVVLGERIVDRDHVSFDLMRFIGRHGERPDVEGFLMGFRGLRLAGSSIRPLESLHTPTNFANPQQVMLRPRKLIFKGVGEVVFDWAGRGR